MLKPNLLWPGTEALEIRTKNYAPRTMKLSYVLPFASVVLSLVPGCPAVGQLTPDNTLGAENSVVTPVDPTRDRIDGGAARGSNLFHSFQEFNVDAGKSVYFANPTGIENILTRVTGGNPSNILGRLGVLGEANLFLVNPNGIIFGPNGSLDISGSFFATTAEGIKLGPDGIFSATNPDGSQLLHIQPEAIFTNALANHMAKVNNQASLAVGVGSTLALQGGEVTVTGSLAAPEGTVMVLGERVGLLDNASIDVSGQRGNGRVLIGGGPTTRDNLPTALRTYIGPDVTIGADALSTGDGGTVIARAEEVTGFYGQISARGGRSSGNGGKVEVSGNSHLIFRGQVDTSAVNGNPGTLQLETTDIIVGDGAGITDNDLIADDILKAPLGEISSDAPITIYSEELEGFSGNTQVMATNDIQVADLQDDLLELVAGRGEIAFTADADNDGVGDFVMQGLGDSISTQGRDISISGANVTFGISFMGEAGQLITDAMVVSTSPGVPLESISGELSNGTDVDLYQVYLRGEGTFSATTVGGTERPRQPTQLYLFDANGIGIYGNDDDPNCGCFQSTLPAGNALTPTASGIYYLGIAGSRVNPVSTQGEIFSDNEVSMPTGAGGGSQLSGWEGNGFLSNVGKYSIALTGVEGTANRFAEPRRGEIVTDGGVININANNGNIGVGNLDSSSIGESGEIKITAQGDIRTGKVNSNNSSGERAGSIAMSAGGDIRTETIDSISIYVFESAIDAKDGGNIALMARGNIATETITSDSTSVTGKGGNGGAIAMRAGEDIKTGNISSSSSGFEDAGSGGEISFTSGGNITIGDIFSGSESELGNPQKAGDITIEAGEKITTENLDSNSDSVEGNKGDGGEISLTSSNDSITTGSLESSGAVGGNITITAKKDITLITSDSESLGINASGDNLGGNISFTSQTGAISIENFLINSNAGLSETVESGNGGSLSLAANAVNFKNVDVSTTVSGQGNSGTIAINTSGEVTLDRTRLFTGLEPDSIGDGGNIEITAGSVSLTNSSFIDTATSGQGNAGNVTIMADSLSAIDSSIFSITSGEGNAGNVRVQVSDAISLQDISSISTAVDPKGIGDGGEINLFGRSLSLTGGSQLQALTRGVGDSGTIRINVTDEIAISGIGNDSFLSGMFTSSEGENSGRGNSISIRTGRLLVNDGAVVSAETNSPSAGGNITIDANILELRNGGQLLTNAFSSGEAGNITVNVREGVIVSGVDPNFADRIAPPRPREPEVTAPSTLTKAEPNDDLEEAQVLDEFFSLDSQENFNSDVEFATRIPYVSISATGSDPGTVDYYSFQVQVPGTRGTFDIDDGVPDNRADRLNGLRVNTLVSLFDSEGNLLASNDNASPAFGAGGSSDGSDSYLRYGFNTPGTYFIKVENSSTESNGLITAPATYDLQVSLDTPNVTGTVVNAEAASGMFARTSGPGAAGNISINSPQLTVSDGAEISATATATATARGGNITANANRINLTGASNLVAETQGVASAGTVTLQPVRNQPNLIVTVEKGSQISVSTQGAGAGGNLTLKAPEAITLTGPGEILVETGGSGSGGNAEIDTGRLQVRSGATVSAATQGDGDGGNLIVSATERATLTEGSSFSSQTTGKGDAGSLDISTDRFIVSEGAEATVSSTGTGSAGFLRVAAGEAIELDNGTLSAASLDVGDLGDINLSAPSIKLDNNSLITTNAANIATGGNITIKTDFLTARDNSDISANGVSGFGDVDIQAEGIFLDNDSEITATGEVRINGVINPASGLVEFEQSPIDPEKIIAQNFCVLAKESSFIVTGRGGIAINPGDYLTGEGIRVGLVDSVTGENSTDRSLSPENRDNDVADDEIRQAQGWVQLPDGTVVLTSYPVIPTSHGPLLQHPGCNSQ